jgi:hypothetical protein
MTYIQFLQIVFLVRLGFFTWCLCLQGKKKERNRKRMANKSRKSRSKSPHKKSAKKSRKGARKGSRKGSSKKSNGHKKTSEWVKFVRRWAAENKVTYPDALKAMQNPHNKAGYKARK